MSEGETKQVPENRPINEKGEEKEVEKRDEKRDESWEEKWQRDPLSAAVWAVILIWAGIAFLLGNLGVFDRIRGLETWGVVLMGAGVIVLIEVLIRALIPEYRKPILGPLIFGVALVLWGLGDVLPWLSIWPIIIVIVGISLLVRGLRARG
ncbi:MAG: hypothetical protein GXY76_15510 [Chloroflexi bacterium]|nr:hypothetical protein [Chloroflexota bacterium]